MGWKLFRALRWASDATKPALNKLGALLFATDTKRLYISLASGYVGADTPPVGATYIRFPGKSDPATLWPNTTWSNISSETLLKGRGLRIEGDFATGRGAAAFGSTQDDQEQAHKHGISAGQGSHSHGVSDPGHAHGTVGAMHSGPSTGGGHYTSPSYQPVADSFIYGTSVATTSLTVSAATLPAMTADSIVTDGSNGTPRTGNETRMANVTIQVWQRTA